MSLKLSVVIPIYNSENYLKQCIDSVINQSYQNIEVILVNDGSTDSSGAICDEYLNIDKRIKVIHQKNARIGAARNNGINNATGDVITFIDSDDYIEPNTYKDAIECMLKYEADLVQWDVNFIPEEGCTDIIHNREISDYTELNLNNIEALNKMLEYKNMDNRFNNLWTATHCIWTKIYKTKLFNDLRFPERKEYEDEMILHHLFYKSNKSIFINKRFSNYRLRKNSTVHTMKLKGRLDKVDAFLDRFNMIINLESELLIKGMAHDYLVCILNCYIHAEKENNNDIKLELIMKAKDLFNRGRKYLSNVDLLVLKILIIWPKGFYIIYSNYRAIKDKY